MFAMGLLLVVATASGTDTVSNHYMGTHSLFSSGNMGMAKSNVACACELPHYLARNNSPHSWHNSVSALVVLPMQFKPRR